jgi:outer membrane protein TolC
VTVRGPAPAFALILALAAASAAAPAARAADGDTLRLSLDEAVALALANGDEMRPARATIREANGRIRSAMAEALPQLSGAVTYSRKLSSLFEVPEGDTSGIGTLLSNSSFAARNTWTVDITARQLLYSGGKVGAALRAAREVRKAADALYRESEMEVRYQVRRAYLDAALTGRVVAIAESSLAQARRHLAQVRLFRREGARSEYELLRAEVDAANQEPPLVEARSAHTLAMLQLRSLLNLPLQRPLALTTPLVAEDATVPVVEATGLGRESRPALTAAEAEVVARRMALKVERGRRWPDLYLTSTLSHAAFPADEWPERREFRRAWDAGARLEFPIFLGLRTEGGIQVARAELERAETRRDQLRESVDVEIEQARTELERTAVTLAARRETVRQAKRAHELASVRFGDGLSPQIEVSDARLQYQSAELNEVQATRDYLVAVAALEKAVGRTLPSVRRPLDAVGGPDDAKEGR